LFWINLIINEEVSLVFKVTSNTELSKNPKYCITETKCRNQKKALSKASDILIKAFASDFDSELLGGEIKQLYLAVDSIKSKIDHLELEVSKSLMTSPYHLFLNQSLFGISLFLYGVLNQDNNSDIILAMLDNYDYGGAEKLDWLIDKAISHNYKIETLKNLKTGARRGARKIKINKLAVPTYSAERGLNSFKDDLKRSLLKGKYFKFKDEHALNLTAKKVLRKESLNDIFRILELRYESSKYNSAEGVTLYLSKDSKNLHYTYSSNEKKINDVLLTELS